MCGIFASIGFEPDKSRIDVVQHRGPDGDGWKVFPSVAGPVALGHRRLAIIDMSNAAMQPMSDFEGRYWLVFNGEIYNYIELRAELCAAGHVFRTRSDSEVLLTAFMVWRERALDRLVGMFSFAIWDAKDQRLFVARDRFGIKPLYFFAGSKGIAFASEIKQLVGLPGDPGRINLTRARDFLESGLLDHTSETLFAGVSQVRGGECLTLDLAHWRPGDPVPLFRWYKFPEPGTIHVSEANAAEKFRELLSGSVRLHLRSDVPVGSCLSGGLDSSSIVCLMSRLLEAEGTGARVNSVSACYAEKSVDERPFMETVVRSANCIPHYVYPSPRDAFDLAEKITWHQDEPYGSTSIFAQWCVFEEARRQGIKVMLDGQGADEQLAGYHSGFRYYFADLVRRGRFIALLRSMLERKSYHGLSLVEQVKSLVLALTPRPLIQLIRRGHRSALLHGWLDGSAFGHIDPSRGAFDTALAVNDLGPVKDIGDLCVALTKGANLSMLLHWEDRSSMAHSIEARVPFLDHRLVEFTIGLGDQHKIVGGDTKRVLRRGMAGILPDEVANRRDKLGFATPEETWFRGPLRAAIKAGVEDTLRLYPDLFNVSGTQALAADMLEGRRPIDFTLWRIVNFGVWGRIFKLSA